MTIPNDILEMIGGKRRYTGMDSYINFGYNPIGDRSKAEEEAVAKFMMSPHIQEFDPSEDIQEIQGDEVKLWRYERQANGGRLQPRSYQLTGSCVNSGAQNASSGQIAIEKLMCSRPESIFMPFTLLAYGQSRAALGDNSPGEGSSGAQMAMEMAEIGLADTALPGLPKPTILDVDGSQYKDQVIVYSKQVELQFSAARNHKPEWLADAAKSKLKYTRIRSADEAIVELRRGRHITWAGDWGGKMQMDYSGTPRVLFCPRRYDTWGHQESSSGYWRHPDLGEIFNICNNWFQQTSSGLCIPVHGMSADDSPSGSYWIPKKEFDYQCRTGEVCSVYSVDGRIRTMDWFVGV